MHFSASCFVVFLLVLPIAAWTVPNGTGPAAFSSSFSRSARLIFTILSLSARAASGAIDVYTLLAHPTQQQYKEVSMPALLRIAEQLAPGEFNFHHHWYLGSWFGDAPVADRSGYLRELKQIETRIRANPGKPAVLFSWDISMYGPGYQLNLTSTDFADLEALKVPTVWHDPEPFKSKLFTQVFPDDYDGGFQVAGVFCSLIGSGKKRRTLLTVRGPAGNWNSERRVEGFKAGLEANGCAHLVDMPAHLDKNCDWNRQKAYQFTRRALALSHVDGIFACNDVMSDGAIQAAKEMRLEGTLGLLINGYDAIPKAVEHINNGVIYATVDNAMFWEEHGMLPTLVNLFRGHDYDNPEGMGTVFWPIALHTSVMDSYVRTELLQGYLATNPPSRGTPVHVQIKPETLQDVDLSQGQFVLSGRLIYNWVDPKLRYLERVWRVSSLTFTDDQIWVARLLPFEFIDWRTTLFSLQVSPRGAVEMVVSFKLNAQCHYDVTKFPADHHNCSVRFVAAKSDFEVASFSNLRETYQMKGWSEVTFSAEHLMAGGQLNIRLVRQREAFLLPIIVPSMIVTMATIGSLEVPVPKEDRLNFMMVAILTAYTLRGSISHLLPLTADITWIDWWLLMNNTFQIMIGLKILCDFHLVRTLSRMERFVEKRCWDLSCCRYLQNHIAKAREIRESRRQMSPTLENEPSEARAGRIIMFFYMVIAAAMIAQLYSDP